MIVVGRGSARKMEGVNARIRLPGPIVVFTSYL